MEANKTSAPHASKENIELLPATPSDLPALVALQFEVYQTVTVEQIAVPNTPETRQSTVERHAQHMRDDPGLHIVKAIDTSTPDNKIVGFCMFYVPTRSPDNPDEFVLPIPLREPKQDIAPTAPRTPAEEAETSPPAGQAMNAENSSGIALSRTNLRELLPERYINSSRLISESKVGRGAGYVRYMAVDQSYRRCGIGRRIMEWGVNLFDEHGVDVYLEATAEGAALYKQYGFEKVSDQILKVDGVERARYPCMWRPARV